MLFYSLSKEERVKKVEEILKNILSDLLKDQSVQIEMYFSDEDTYIRKNAYQAIGKLYRHKKDVRQDILKQLNQLIRNADKKIRQTTVNAAGEIGITDFQPIEQIMEAGLFDRDPKVRNAVIGSLKKMGEKNPKPVLTFARKFLHHPDKEIRREICHGIELRGRKHPEDILPLLKELEHDKAARVRNTLIHVLGQISYKKGCLEKVVEHLNTWENKKLVEEAFEEIIDVHHRYRNFAAKDQEEVREYILKNARDPGTGELQSEEKT